MPDENQPSINLMALIPPRVNVAINVVALFSQKQHPMAISGPSGIEFHEGQKLTKEESLAHAAAANCLRKYFVNDLEPDVWDSIMINTASPDIAPTEPSGLSSQIAQQPESPTPNATTFMEYPCGLCAGKTGNIGCHLCHGCGKIAVFPRSSIQG